MRIFRFFYLSLKFVLFLLCICRCFCISLFHLYDRALLHRNTAVFVVAELNDNGIICDVDDDSVEAAGGQNAISDLQSRKHCAGLLLLFLLRTIQYEVEKYTKNYHLH